MADSFMECKSTCLKNCSCTAYAYEKNQRSIWIGDLLNLQQLGYTTAGSLYIKIAASEISNPTNKRMIIVAVAISAGMLLLGLIMFIIMRGWNRTIITAKPAEVHSWLLDTKIYRRQPKISLKNWGKGGFGSVFKGTLPDASIIAVKKLESIDQGMKQFRTEVSTLGKINHVNLVRLRGFCSQARGLAYLHENCRDSIIHCDIKPENILLDVDFCPKLADFSLAKLLGREFSRVLTTMRGTMGYLAPEWISGVTVTPKADVYSFGMMLLEFVSGRRNFEQTNDEARYILSNLGS
ncbi:hypothetical protein CRYUN_Cryun18bG0063400 [Craigia yunnanensis]